jgi:signal peptidase I
MEPTLHCAQPGQGCGGQVSDGAVVQEPASDLSRGDIVLFRTPGLALHECGAEGKFIKRLIGLPGDVWEERSGFVYINGKKLNEPYILPDRRDDRTLGLSDLPRATRTCPGTVGTRASVLETKRLGLSESRGPLEVAPDPSPCAA